MRNGAAVSEFGRVAGAYPGVTVDAIWKVLPDGSAVSKVAAAEYFEILFQGNGNPIETQRGSGVVGNEIILAVACLDSSVQLGHGCGFTQHLTGGNLSEQHYELGRDQLDLLLQPKIRADFQFVAAGRSILRRAALYAIGDEKPVARDALASKKLVQVAARGADERTTGCILLASGAFTQYHDFSVRRPFSRYRLPPALVKPACDTPANPPGEVFELFAGFFRVHRSPKPHSCRREFAGIYFADRYAAHKVQGAVGTEEKRLLQLSARSRITVISQCSR